MKFTSPDLAELIRVAKTITGSKRVRAIARLVHLGLPLGEAEVRSLMGRYWDLKRAKRLALENGIHVVWNDSALSRTLAQPMLIAVRIARHGQAKS
jgi:hypothetical protein